MATRHARSTPAVLLIAAGALTILGVALTQIPALAGGVYSVAYLLSYLAIAVAFLLLARSFSSRLGGLALNLAAAGWAVYGIAALLGVPLLAPLAGLVAIVFGIIAAVVIFRHRFFTPRASTGFLTTSIIGAVYLLFPITSLATFLLAVAFGVSLITTGTFLQRRR